MTPDTAALRALADEVAAFRRLTPNWQRFRPEAGSVLVDPDTVRALCAAADEVERLRALLAVSLAYLDGAGAGVARLRDQRDASRTAHAALVAELRAKVAEARTWRGYKTRDIGDAFDATTVTDLLDDLTALLDRHAPTLTTTED